MVTLDKAHEINLIKASGKKEAFEVDKLRNSLLNSGADDGLVEDVIEHILPELHEDMTTSELYTHAFDILRERSRPIARSYSLRRAVMDLGPSGFPFEDFVAEILKAKGFKTLTRQTVLGGCVPHEVDVVAWNAKKLIMVEAKFHNELGTKSDLKVALYIKARFDDIKDNVYNYGGEDRSVTDSWLMTNTKFSSTAIHYGVCKDLTMIGWNYPEKGSLQDMIQEEGLHPVTCLTSISHEDKKNLIANNIVLCSSIRDNPELLDKFADKNVDKDVIMKEIKELYV